MRKIGGAGALVLIVSGCGGAEPAPVAPDPAAAAATAAPSATPPPAAAAPSTPAAATPPPAPAAPAAAAPSAVDQAYSDPNEHPDGFALTPLFDKSKSKGSFPKQSVDDGACWTTVGVTGNHSTDYDAIVAACGMKTGLSEYAKPVEGKLHQSKDPRDVYTLKLLGGYCYRYFAVADAGITDLDLLIEKPGGALVGDDKTNSPIAIIESDKPWCVDSDQTLEFHVQVKGTSGTGGYMFGVWARPKK